MEQEQGRQILTNAADQALFQAVGKLTRNKKKGISRTKVKGQ